MQVELNAEEVHWLRYSVIMAIANLPDDNADLRVVYEGVLKKLSDRSSSFVSENLLESLKPPKIYLCA